MKSSMDIKNKALSVLSENILARNGIFKNSHKGESCYIFGNGISLKDMDLGKFNDKVSFGCTYLWFHKDFDALNVKYYATIAPFWFYRYWRHSISGQYKRNYQSSMQKRIQRLYPHINFFTSLSNRFGIFGDNVYYVHHFDVENPSDDTFDMTGSLYYRGILDALIGMAIYMGFKSAHLVGCDYTHSPQRILHFYEKGRGKIEYNDDHVTDFLGLAAQYIDLTTITTNGSISKILKYVDYQDYTGAAPRYRENTELVSKEYLDVMALDVNYLIY